MDVAFARRTRQLLDAGGLPVSHHGSDAGHHIDPTHIPAAIQWLAAATGESRRAAMTSTLKGR
jgi:phospholipase/carboxylesterase